MVSCQPMACGLHGSQDLRRFNSSILWQGVCCSPSRWSCLTSFKTQILAFTVLHKLQLATCTSFRFATATSVIQSSSDWWVPRLGTITYRSGLELEAQKLRTSAPHHSCAMAMSDLPSCNASAFEAILRLTQVGWTSMDFLQTS